MTMTFLSRSAAIAALAGGFLAAEAGPAMACPSQPYMGTMCYVGFNYCPVGWLPANGAKLNISEYQALFAILGTTYGGDGVRDFGLPDLRGRNVLGQGAGTGLTPRALGAVVGGDVKSAILPPHSHNAAFTPTGTVTSTATAGLTLQAVNPADPTLNSTAPSVANSYIAGSPAASTGGQMWTGTMANPVNVGGVDTPATGGTGAAITGGTVIIQNTGTPTTTMTTLPPQTGLTACIAVQGIFPQQQ